MHLKPLTLPTAIRKVNNSHFRPCHMSRINPAKLLHQLCKSNSFWSNLVFQPLPFGMWMSVGAPLRHIMIKCHGELGSMFVHGYRLMHVPEFGIFTN